VTAVATIEIHHSHISSNCSIRSKNHYFYLLKTRLWEGLWQVDDTSATKKSETRSPTRFWAGRRLLSCSQLVGDLLWNVDIIDWQSKQPANRLISTRIIITFDLQEIPERQDYQKYEDDDDGNEAESCQRINDSHLS